MKLRTQGTLAVALLMSVLNSASAFASDEEGFSTNNEAEAAMAAAEDQSSSVGDVDSSDDQFQAESRGGIGRPVVIGRPGGGRVVVRPIPPVRRVYPPVYYRGGRYPYARWNYPVFVRPVYYFNWAALRLVTCTSQNSYGNQYPVTEAGYYGYVYQSKLREVEDASLNRCFAESGGDTGCRLIGCTAGY